MDQCQRIKYVTSTVDMIKYYQPPKITPFALFKPRQRSAIQPGGEWFDKEAAGKIVSANVTGGDSPLSGLAVHQTYDAEYSCLLRKSTTCHNQGGCASSVLLMATPALWTRAKMETPSDTTKNCAHKAGLQRFNLLWCKSSGTTSVAVIDKVPISRYLVITLVHSGEWIQVVVEAGGAGVGPQRSLILSATPILQPTTIAVLVVRSVRTNMNVPNNL